MNLFSLNLSHFSYVCLCLGVRVCVCASQARRWLGHLHLLREPLTDMVFWANTGVFGANTVVFWTNTVAFLDNTVVFQSNIVVFGDNTVVFGQIQCY